jgi:cation transport ATPase
LIKNLGHEGISAATISDGNDIANALALQDDGWIVAAGTDISRGFSNIVVVRYNKDGSIDKNFGTDGY